MATRRTKKRHSGHNSEPETVDQMIDRVLSAFERWLTEREPDQQRRGDVTDIVHTACELKSSYLGESNPADWDPSLVVEVVGQLIPRKVVGVDGRYVSTLVPAMMVYIEFLVLSGRWKPHNDAAATRTALASIEPGLPGRFTDPDRLTMVGRLMQVALDEGVDVTESEAMSGFMQRFNDMPYEWRKRLTDAPGMPGLHAGVDFAGLHDEAHDELWDEGDDLGMLDDPDALEILATAAAMGITAIGFVADEAVTITVPDARSELAALLATPLLTRMIALAEWVRPGRKLTSTFAIRRDDTAELMRRFGILADAGSPPKSMWDLSELAAPWSIAAGCGLIDSSTTKARPGPNSDVFDRDDLAAQVLCARTAVEMLIEGLIDARDGMSELDVAVVGLLLTVLAGLCRPEGADLAELRSLAHPGVEPADYAESIGRILFAIVLNIVEMLKIWGLVAERNGRSSVPAVLRPAVVQAIYTEGAPFTFRLEPKAIPLEFEE